MCADIECSEAANKMDGLSISDMTEQNPSMFFAPAPHINVDDINVACVYYINVRARDINVI